MLIQDTLNIEMSIAAKMMVWMIKTQHWINVTLSCWKCAFISNVEICIFKKSELTSLTDTLIDFLPMTKMASCLRGSRYTGYTQQHHIRPTSFYLIDKQFQIKFCFESTLAICILFYVSIKIYATQSFWIQAPQKESHLGIGYMSSNAAKN